MIFFTSTRLAKAKNNCPEALAKVAAALGNEAEDFKAAVEAGDTEKLDGLIEKGIQTYTGQENTIYGLFLYCQKFDLSLDHPAASELELLELISKNREEISQILKDNGV